MKKHVRNEEGFTLIEIIAVLVILGILAAVAVPKFIDLQQSAQEKAIQGALAAVKSQVVLDYSSAILSAPTQASNWVGLGAAGTSSQLFGDFSGLYNVSASTGSVLVTVASGPNTTWFVGTSTASFNIY